MSNRKKQPLKVITLGGLLAHPFTKREHLLEPWLRQGESVMVWAASGLGKTMLTLTMALAVAGGGEFLEWRSAKPRKVLVVDGEMHAEDLRDRLEMLMPTVAGLDAEAAAENLTLMPRQFQGADTDFPDLATPDGQETVMAKIRECQAEMVILDNFSTLAEVPDENEAAAMNPVLGFLLKLKQAGVACILVHHSGKTGGAFRGSSKLATTFEVILGLKAHEEAAPTAGATFETVWDKFRGEPHESIREAIVKLEKRPDGSHEWVTRVAETDAIRLLLAELRKQEHGTQESLAAALGWSTGQVSKIKAKAIRENRVTKDEWSECLTEGHLKQHPPEF